METLAVKREAGMTALAMRPRDVAAFFWLLVMALPVMKEVLAPAITGAVWYTVTIRVAFALISTVWLVSDAKLRGIPAFNYCTWSLVVPDITVPTYVVRTRGWIQFAMWLGKVAAVVLSALFFSLVLITMLHGIHHHAGAV